VIAKVWELYRLAHQLTGGAATLLEWDANIPPFPVVHAEVLKARDFLADPAATAPLAPAAGVGAAAVSNPLAFLVPAVEGRAERPAAAY
jgi:hypothetical protein